MCWKILLLQTIQNGQTPLYLASLGDYKNIVDFLLGRGANPNLARIVGIGGSAHGFLGESMK